MFAPYSRIVYEEELLVECPACRDEVIRFMVEKQECDEDIYIFTSHCPSCNSTCRCPELGSLLSYLSIRV